LIKQIRGKLLVIRDGLPAHRSRVVKDYVESLDGHLVLERLPVMISAITGSSVGPARADEGLERSNLGSGPVRGIDGSTLDSGSRADAATLERASSLSQLSPPK
jgi:hypothetical protein